MAREILGLDRGPTFYTKTNYKGAKFAPGKSVGVIYHNTKKNGDVMGLNIRALDIPKGWCVSLYSDQKWKGTREAICGPKKIWSLQDVPLVKTFVTKIGASRTRKTTWYGNVASFRMTHFRYMRRKVTKKCPTKCHTASSVLAGDVVCMRSHGGLESKVMDDKACQDVKVTKPHPILLNCDVVPKGCARHAQE